MVRWSVYVCVSDLYVFPCGPAMSWRLVQGVTLSSPNGCWDRRRPRDLKAGIDDGWMDGWISAPRSSFFTDSPLSSRHCSGNLSGEQTHRVLLLLRHFLPPAPLPPLLSEPLPLDRKFFWSSSKTPKFLSSPPHYFFVLPPS